MFIFIIAILCHFILATHLENNQKDLYSKKSLIENLPDGPIYEIMNHLEEKEKEQLSKTSHEFFKYDPREVVLNLPLRKRKEVTKFVCDHLKLRKKLAIRVEDHYFGYTFFSENSLEKKILECLNGIEYLRFSSSRDETIVLVYSGLKLEDFFPKLKHMDFILDYQESLSVIPNNLKSLKFYHFSKVYPPEKLKEKITEMNQLEILDLKINLYMGDREIFSPMIKELPNLPNFKRLSVEHRGTFEGLRTILSETEHAKYQFNLKSHINTLFSDEIIFEFLPKTTESIHLDYHEIEDLDKFCQILPSLIHLKKLILHPGKYGKNFDCLLESLPSSLSELTYRGILYNSDIGKIKIPKSLDKVNIFKVTTKVFELLANHVTTLNAEIMDPENLLMIEKPFIKVKSLVTTINNSKFYLKRWFPLLDLLPQNMDSIDIKAEFFDTNEDYDFLEEKILSLKKRIKHFYVNGLLWGKTLNIEYTFDGTKMIRNK